MWLASRVRRCEGSRRLWSSTGQLVKNIRSDGEVRLHTYYADDAAVIENLMTATVTGQFLGIPGNGKQVRFRALHVFEFRDGRISRENLWLDGAGLTAQLTS